MRRLLFACIIAITCGICGLHVSEASALSTDYFVRNASGNAIYEAMVIAPSAVYDQDNDTTWVAYQGYMLDPYVAGFDHTSSTWTAATRVGDNPLIADAHGGTSTLLDSDGRLHVFYGSHGTALSLDNQSLSLRHSLMPYPQMPDLRIEEILRSSTGLLIDATYPKPFLLPDGTTRLFLRSGHTTKTPELDGYYDWFYTDFHAERSTWSTRTVIIDAQRSTVDSITAWDSFYVDVSQNDAGTMSAAITYRDLRYAPTNAFVRRGLYYLTEGEDGLWRSVSGTMSVDTSGNLTPWTKESLDASCLVEGTEHLLVNQVVVQQMPDGNPAILFLSQEETSTAEDPPEPQWAMARFVDGSWDIDTICSTDNFFDAGDFTVLPSGDFDAFLVTGGEADETALPNDPFATRGGDIVRWRWSSANEEWSTSNNDVVIRAESAALRFNDPQIVDGPNGSHQLVFSEWNNDATSFIHRVYLCSVTNTTVTFHQNETNPAQHRLWGQDRIETAISASQEAFPTGFAHITGSTVIVATSEKFADALASTSLCSAYRAPLLLNPSGYLDPRVADEISRLKPRRIILLGGTSALATSVESSLRSIKILSDFNDDTLYVDEVMRISGSDRYETAARIAEHLVALRGPRSTVVIASGENFPDGLAVSGLAGRKGYPLLLTKRDTIPTATIEAIRSIMPQEVLIIGGTAAIATSIESRINLETRYIPTRLHGADRYETARVIADFSRARNMGPERIVVSSGEDFPDALTGGWLAARYNAILAMTKTDRVPPATMELMMDYHPYITDTYVIGGPSAIDATVATWLATGAKALVP